MIVMPPIEWPTSTTGPRGAVAVEDRPQVAPELVDRRVLGRPARRTGRGRAGPRTPAGHRPRPGRQVAALEVPAVHGCSASRGRTRPSPGRRPADGSGPSTSTCSGRRRLRVDRYDGAAQPPNGSSASGSAACGTTARRRTARRPARPRRRRRPRPRRRRTTAARRPHVGSRVTALTRRLAVDVDPGDPRADPGDDLVGDGAGRVGPVLRGRLAVVAGAEQHHLVARRDVVVAEVEHELVHADPAGDGPAAPGSEHRPDVAAGARDAVGVAERHQRRGWSPGRWCRVPVGHAAAGRHPLDQGTGPRRASSPGAARTPRGRPRRGPARARRRRCPGRTRSKCVLGRGQGGGRVGQVAHLGVDARAARRARPPRGRPRPGGRWSGGPARRRRRSATTARRPARRPRPRPCARPRPGPAQSASAAPPRPSPVSTLRCTRAVVPVCRAAATTSSRAQPR